MNADDLRAVAADIREKADAADPDGWDAYSIILCYMGPDADHIAAWRPAVAFAIADWLDGEAEYHTGRWARATTGSPLTRDVSDVAVAFVKAWRGES